MKPKIYTFYIYAENDVLLADLVKRFQQRGYPCQLQYSSATGEYRIALLAKAFTKIGGWLAAKFFNAMVSLVEWMERH